MSNTATGLIYWIEIEKSFEANKISGGNTFSYLLVGHPEKNTNKHIFIKAENQKKRN